MASKAQYNNSLFSSLKSSFVVVLTYLVLWPWNNPAFPCFEDIKKDNAWQWNKKRKKNVLKIKFTIIVGVDWAFVRRLVYKFWKDATKIWLIILASDHCCQTSIALSTSVLLMIWWFIVWVVHKLCIVRSKQ